MIPRRVEEEHSRCDKKCVVELEQGVWTSAAHTMVRKRVIFKANKKTKRECQVRGKQMDRTTSVRQEAQMTIEKRWLERGESETL